MAHSICLCGCAGFPERRVHQHHSPHLQAQVCLLLGQLRQVFDYFVLWHECTTEGHLKLALRFDGAWCGRRERPARANFSSHLCYGHGWMVWSCSFVKTKHDNEVNQMKRYDKEQVFPIAMRIVRGIHHNSQRLVLDVALTTAVACLASLFVGSTLDCGSATKNMCSCLSHPNGRRDYVANRTLERSDDDGKAQD